MGSAQNFTVVADGALGVSPADHAAQEEFNRRVARLYRAVAGAISAGNEVESRLKAIRKALQDTPAAGPLSAQADSIEKNNNVILRALRGDVAIAAHSENVPPSINDRVNYIMEAARFSITRPTQTQQDAYSIAAEEFAQQLAHLRSLVQTDLAKLEKDMEAAGAPWTPGRVPDWQESK